MDSNNWRIKRDTSDSPAKEDTLPARSWGRISGTPDSKRQLNSSSWGALPAYEGNGRDYIYRGGRNPTRGTHSASQFSDRSYRTPILPDQEAEQAIEQQRRIYVGNLPYEAKLDDIRSLFADISGLIQDITMSVDPMTGRNPSYCFVDFTTKEAAAQAIETFSGQVFMRRPLKVKPGVKPVPRARHGENDDRPSSSFTSTSGETNESPFVFNRWRRIDAQIDTENLNNSATEEGRRLYVGGLPKFPNQAAQNTEIRDLFGSFKINVVSKLISPHSSILEAPGNHYYCFVDLHKTEDVDGAIATLNGLDMWNWNIIISRASKAISGKLHERQRLYVAGLPTLEDEKTLKNEITGLFQRFGEVKLVSKVLQKSDSNPDHKNTGYCFVEMADGAQADAAIASLDQTERWDWKVSVRRANPPKKKMESWRGGS
jgi:RNA recognition motif-containing protein